MKNLISYRGYNAKLEFDAEDNLFFGHVLGVPESITFHGDTVAQLTEDFHAAVDHYIADCEATGRGTRASGLISAHPDSSATPQ